LSDFHKIWIFSTDIFKKVFKYQTSRKSVQRKPICFIRTERHTHMTKLTVAVRYFANAPNKYKHWSCQIYFKSGQKYVPYLLMSHFFCENIKSVSLLQCISLFNGVHMSISDLKCRVWLLQIATVWKYIHPYVGGMYKEYILYIKQLWH
jgi:hypothetical protein